MIAAFGAGILAGFAIAIPVGAVGILILFIAAQHGWRAGAAAGLGTATVDGGYAAVAVLLGASLAPFLRHIETPLRWASVVVLVLVALAVLRPAFAAPTTARSDAEARRLTPGRAYLRILGLTAINPATIVYFAALVAGASFGRVTEPAVAIAFIVGVFVASAAWQLVLAAAGAHLGRFLVGPRGRRWSAIVGAAVILLLAAKTAFGF